jgi:hypothetical protein
MAFQIDPLVDRRWEEFLQRHPRASTFHTAGWLDALRRTYGYRPVVYTSSPPGVPLKDGIAFCEIRSWLTGNRLVSLPFADHCEPLVDDSNDRHALFRFVEQEQAQRGWKYVEVRPLTNDDELRGRWKSAQSYRFHSLDLRPDLDSLRVSFHKGSVQRGIRKAERLGLTYQSGRSNELVDTFYRLMLLTRRRHQLPPHPLGWFRNLVTCMGDQLTIRVASLGGQPLASILTLRFRQGLVYKYGCSDRTTNQSGSVFLFWKAIQEAKQDGLCEFDLGRSDVDNAGLIAFKDHWTTTRRTLQYARYPAPVVDPSEDRKKVRLAKHVFARMPDRLLAFSGRFLYRHIG